MSLVSIASFQCREEETDTLHVYANPSAGRVVISTRDHSIVTGDVVLDWDQAVGVANAILNALAMLREGKHQ